MLLTEASRKATNKLLFDLKKLYQPAAKENIFFSVSKNEYCLPCYKLDIETPKSTFVLLVQKFPNSHSGCLSGAPSCTSNLMRPVSSKTHSELKQTWTAREGWRETAAFTVNHESLQPTDLELCHARFLWLSYLLPQPFHLQFARSGPLRQAAN